MPNQSLKKALTGFLFSFFFQKNKKDEDDSALHALQALLETRGPTDIGYIYWPIMPIILKPILDNFLHANREHILNSCSFLGNAQVANRPILKTRVSVGPLLETRLILFKQKKLSKDAHNIAPLVNSM